MTNLLLPLLTGAELAFWICGPLSVLGAIGLVASRRAVYSALSVAFAMINLAVIYASLDAPFLFVVQIIVYTGAVMMMFLFVLMMVGVDKPESLVETIKGQRALGIIAGVGLLALLVVGVLDSVPGGGAGVTEANAQFGGNVQSLAALIFGRHVFAFELTSSLLITAAVGAMVLAHVDRVRKKPDQKERALDRMKAYMLRGEHPGAKPNSGVYAASNSISMPALLPDGSISTDSLSPTLVQREEMDDPAVAIAASTKTFKALEAAADEEE